MGVLNVTPDSFFASSRATIKDEILHKTTQFLNQGVDIIDIGAVSTRPNTDKYASEGEEIDRITIALELIKKEFPNLIISCDTFRAKVVEIAIQNYDVAIINDISGGTFDPKMLETIAKFQVPYVLMHTKGTLYTMHQETNYQDLISEMMLFFATRIQALRKIGVNDIIIDPGFGFAKTLDQNFELLKRISYLRNFECPIMVGLSRKSMFYKTFNTSPEESLNATSVSNLHVLQSGANILRVHDVKEARETIELYRKMKI
jgi:dihydropteroate synthase